MSKSPAHRLCFALFITMLATGALAVTSIAATHAHASAWVENGQPRAVIVTADDAYPIAEYAAQELAYHIELATGVTLPILTEGEAAEATDPRIYVGQSDAARAQGIDHEQLESEQCVIRRIDEDLYIVGNDGDGHPLHRSNTHSGTLWGVYEVLEELLDVRWLWPGELGIEAPATETVSPGSWDVTIKPDMVRRDIRTPIHWGGGDKLHRFDYSLHGMLREPQRSGIAYSSDDALDAYVWAEQIFLRRHRIGRSDDPRPYTGHSFRGWWEEYGEEHPEWFQKLPEGEVAHQWRERFDSVYGVGSIPEEGWEDHRGSVDPDRPNFTSMCVSNTEFQQEIVDRWRRDREEDPENIRIHVGENDIPALCACEECRALDDPQPTDEEWAEIPGYARGQYRPMNAGRRYAIFWRQVREKAAEIDPDVIVTAFVYLNYFVAPDDVELHENIVLSFCPWGGWWFPRDPREQVWLREQWHNWQATGATLYYRPNYLLNGGSMPHVYARQMGEELQYFHRQGSIGTDFDTLTGQWAVNLPTLYVLSRFHNRPELSVGEMLDELYAAFGPAAQQVKAYFDFWESHTTANRALHGFGGATHTYVRRAHEMYPPEAFEHAESILDRAEEQLADTSTERYGQRIDYLRLGLTHARKVAELAALFADSDIDSQQIDTAVDELVAFRREAEHRHIANFAYAGRNEMRTWGDQFDFNLNEDD